MSSAFEYAGFEYGIVRWGCLRRIGDFEGQQPAIGSFSSINGGEEASLIVGCVTVDSDLLASLVSSFCRLKFRGFIDIPSGSKSIEMCYSFVNE